MTETIYLIEVNAYTYGIEGPGDPTETFRFCTGKGYTTAPTDSPANTWYSPRVEHPGLFRQDMFSPGATSGNSTGGYGEITLINTDGGLDDFIDYGFDGRTCVVKQGNPDQPLSDFATVITGTVEQAEVSWNRVTLRLKDRTVELNIPLQTTLYAGDNVLPAGIEGVDDLKDKPKPLLYGSCLNISPVMVNTSKLIYQIHNGSGATLSAVYDNGVALTGGAGYADQAAMEATEPAAGEYRYCAALGCFRLGSTPAGTVTADAYSGATAADRTAGQIIKSLVAGKLGADQIVAQSIIDLDAAAPYVVGYYTADSTVDVSAIIDSLCASVGAWWGFDNDGHFWAKQLTAPDAANPIMTLTQAEILSLDRTATADSDKGVPVYKVNIDFAKNWTVQTSGLAGSISQSQLLFEPDDTQQLATDRRNLLGMEYLRTSATDATVQAKHLLAPELTVQTTLASATDAATEATRQLTLRKTRRDRLNVKLSMADTINYADGGYWDDEAITEMPQARQYHTACIYNNWLYVIGGAPPVGASLASVIRLNLSNPSGSWDDAGVTDLPESRAMAAASVYGDYLYVSGGVDLSVFNQLDSVIRLDLSNPSGSWDDAGVTNLPVARYGHAMVVANGYLYVIGGFSGGATASVIRLDLSNPSGSWDDAGVTDLPAARSGHTSVVYGGYLYVLGGLVSGTPTASVIRLNLSNPSGSWDDAGVTDLPEARHGHTAVVYGSSLTVTGGSNAGGYLQSSIRLDLVNPQSAWTPVSDLPVPSASGAAAANTDGSIYFLGGTSSTVHPNTWRLRTNDIPQDTAHKVSLGRTVLVKYPRYGYDSGRPMKIIGVESDHASRIINLELWG